MSQYKFGAHVSTAGGIDKAVERVYEIGGNCLQLFSGSPRVWKKKPLAEFDIDTYSAKINEKTVSPVFTHALYLINLASDKPDLLRKSFDTLKYELEFDALIQGSGVVVHLGSHQGRGWEAVKEQVVEQLRKLLEVTPKSSRLLIENAAGQNGKVAGKLEEIQWLLEQLESQGGFVSSNRVGWCFDTCHGFAAGYNLAASGEKSSIAEIERLKLWETLYCVHVNDSKDPFQSGRDRHQNLGDGTIPEADLKAFVTDKRVKQLPMILEVPGIDGKGPDRTNIDRLKKMLGVS